MNNKLIQQARELCEKATPGKWTIKTERGDYVAVHRTGTPICALSSLNCVETNKANAAFIVASRTIVPQLCDALEAAQKEIRRLEKLVQEYYPKIIRLTARAEKAEAERDTYKAALQNMRFAYVNKDIPPHQFEIDALKETDALIGPLKGE